MGNKHSRPRCDAATVDYVTSQRLVGANRAALSDVNDKYLAIVGDATLSYYEMATKVQALFKEYDVEGIFKQVLKQGDLDTGAFCKRTLDEMNATYDEILAGDSRTLADKIAALAALRERVRQLQTSVSANEGSIAGQDKLEESVVSVFKSTVADAMAEVDARNTDLIAYYQGLLDAASKDAAGGRLDYYVRLGESVNGVAALSTRLDSILEYYNRLIVDLSQNYATESAESAGRSHAELLAAVRAQNASLGTSDAGYRLERDVAEQNTKYEFASRARWARINWYLRVVYYIVAMAFAVAMWRAVGVGPRTKVAAVLLALVFPIEAAYFEESVAWAGGYVLQTLAPLLRAPF
jgi:hypothetical protein